MSRPFLHAWIALALTVTASGCLEAVVLGDGRSVPDAAADDASEPDASEPELDVPRFTEPVLIEALAAGDDEDADDDDPSLNRAMTMMFFNSTRDGGSGREDIWFSQRESASQAWGAPEPAVALNSEDRETGTALSDDGLTVYWSSDRAGGAGGLDVYMAQRATLQDAWSEPVTVDALNTSDDDLISAVSDEGRLLLFARRAGDDSYQLWWARRASDEEPWPAPEPLDVADSDSAESDPFLARDSTLLLFSRDGDLQLAARPDDGAPFGEALPLSTLNSEDGDTDPWSDEDLSYVVFASDRSGESRLYEAWRMDE